jgi:hemerythrin-like metal-binding protein
MEAALAEAFESMDQGFLWLDPQFRVRAHNRAFRHLLGVDDDARFVGQTYSEVLRFLLQRGEFFDVYDHDAFITDRVQAMERRETRRFERVRPNGKVLRVSAVPLDSGGYVHTYLDITAETRAYEDVRRNAKAVAMAMANFSEHRDTDTGVHILRVARLVGQTARELRRRGLFAEVIDDAFVESVPMAAMLHDVGKISTPDRILLKEGPLSDDERAVIQRHAVIGAQLLRQASLVMSESRYLKLGAEIALTHHEWYDGRGYPNRLAGDAIPLSGRICALADVFDALTSRRPYKTPWPQQEAIELIRQQSGSQFDPVVTEAFLDVIEARSRLPLVQWSPSMSVGHVRIDEQHMILLDTINQLASADRENDRLVVSMIIDELVSYAGFHFHFEEQLIEAAGFPGLEQHRRQHEGYVKWVKEVRDEYTYHRRRQLGERMLGFLRDWLSDHILGDDRAYSAYLQRQQPARSQA